MNKVAGFFSGFISQQRAVFRAGLLDAVEYRTDFFISVASWGIRLLIAIFLWSAVAGAGRVIGPYSFESILVYFFIVQIISSLIFSRVIFDINRDIQYGDIANYLLKPVHYLPFRMVYELTHNAFRLLLGIAFFGLLFLFFTPDFLSELARHPLHLLLFAFSLALAYFLNFCIVSTIGLLAFWIVNASRFGFLYFGIITIFSGMLFPLDLLPEKFYEILRMTPFPYIFYFPTKTIHEFPEVSWIFGTVLAPQLLFSMAAAALMTFTYRLGVKRFESVGR